MTHDATDLLAREVELTVVGSRCVYLNDHRIAGSKPYVSENLPQHSFQVRVGEIINAIPALAPKPTLAATNAQQAALREALEGVLPYVEAERLAEEAAIRLGQHRAPIRLAVKKARDALGQLTEGKG